MEGTRCCCDMTQTDRNTENILPKVGSRQQMWNHFHNNLLSQEPQERLTRQVRRSQTWLNQTNHEVFDCSVLPFWAPGSSVPVSVKSDTKQNPTFQPENGQESYVMLGGGRLTHMVNEHIVTGIKFKKIHILPFVPKYKTTRKAGKYKLFRKLNVINPYLMFLGIKTQGLFALSMFHCSLFEPVSLPAQLHLILIFLLQSQELKQLGTKYMIQDSWFSSLYFQFYRISGWHFHPVIHRTMRQSDGRCQLY